MNRLVALGACLLFASACGHHAAEPPAASSAANAGQPAAAPAAAPAPASAAEPAKVEISDDLVNKYIAYQKENIRLVAQFSEESRKNLESAKGDAAKMLDQIAINDKLGKELNEKLKAARTSAGLSEDAFEMVKDAAQAVALGRLAYRQAGGDAFLSKMEADTKKQVEALPAEQRAAAEAEMAKLTQGIKDQRDAVEVRRKYGDQAADVLLKHADALADLQMEGLKTLGGKK
jgi:hypothetical protein